LYEAAISQLLASRSAGDESLVALSRFVLSRVAVANHLATRREFTSTNVEEVLQDHPEALSHWRALASSERGVPLVKIVDNAGDGREVVYQFRHLSFQEALFALALVSGEATWKPEDPSSVTKDLFFRNTLKIGGRPLAEVLKIPFTAD